MAADCKSADFASTKVRILPPPPTVRSAGLALFGDCGCSSMVEQKPSKLTTRVRFPSPAPTPTPPVCEVGATRADIADTGPAFRLTVRDTLAIWPAQSGEVAEWLKAADCKSARASVRWFESSPLHHHWPLGIRPHWKRHRVGWKPQLRTAWGIKKVAWRN